MQTLCPACSVPLSGTHTALPPEPRCAQHGREAEPMTAVPEPANGPPAGVSRYRLVLSTSGALGFVIPGILARFPIGMTGISILLFIASVRHEYGTAGALSATAALGYAVAAPQLARVADRVGQRRILLICAALCGASGAVFVECALRAAPLWTLV